MLKLQHNFALLGEGFSSPTRIQPLKQQRLAEYNVSLATFLNIDFNDIDTLSLLAGDTSIPQSLSMIYAGHQFGDYSPNLGDGRGVLLGEILANDNRVYDLHMKGAGLTPYSRQGDGRAVLRSCIREYLASEAMAGLGVSTSRALALYESDEIVYREGNAEKGAMLLRTARTHIRFGHFEYFFYQGENDSLNLLTEYCLQHYFPKAQQEEKPVLVMLEEVVKRTALMVARWQAIGFQHGVMNTDNMSILGETIDYGPFEFMNDYEPKWICNHSDYSGRYAFDQQPSVALWNLNCLFHCFSKVVERDQLVPILESYEEKLVTYYKKEMCQKLGLNQVTKSTDILLNQLFSILESEKLDYTHFFRSLSNMTSPQDRSALLDQVVDRQALDQWLGIYSEQRSEKYTQWHIQSNKMKRVNPKYILRSHLAQEAILNAEQGDYHYFRDLLAVLNTPYDEHPEYEHFADSPPDKKKKVVINCSS